MRRDGHLVGRQRGRQRMQQDPDLVGNVTETRFGCRLLDGMAGNHAPMPHRARWSGQRRTIPLCEG